jgi:hypothetical protein
VGGDERTVRAQGIRPIARPRIGRGRIRHPGAYRIELDVAAATPGER